jgi:hypothetical protein
MKFIIREDRLEEVIRNFINSHYEVDSIHSTPFHDNEGNPLDIGEEYYLGDYYDDNFIFTLYQKNYWSSSHDFRVKLSPYLMIEDGDFFTNLHSMFGDKWEPIFKQWFKENFGEDIKTIDG